MYWNNCFLNNFNDKIFLNKVIFLENLFVFIFSEKIFDVFFKNFFKKKKTYIFKKGGVKNTQFQKNKTKSYNFTRVWFVKYNNFILITAFCFFYFNINKIKNIKKKIDINFLQKTQTTFWKKKWGPNLKKTQFFFKNHFLF